MNTIFHLAGIGTSISLILLSFAVQRPRIVALVVAVDTFTLIQYLIADSHAAASVTLVSLIYALAMTQAEKHPVLNRPWVLTTTLIIYTATYTVVNKENLASWELLILAGALTSILSMAFTHQILVKIIQMVGNICYAVFSVIIEAYAQLPGQIFCFVLLVASFVYIIDMKQRGHTGQVPEITMILRKNFSPQLKETHV